MERDRDQQVEVELAAVVRGEHAADAVDLAGVELGDELDLFFCEERAEVLGGDRLREGTVERVEKTSSVRARIPRSRRYQSARNANSAEPPGT